MIIKRLYAGLLCAGLLVLVLSFYFYGYENTWRLWNISFLQPPFLDFRVITASAESLRAGYEPGLENPFDPLGRVFNYPKIWYIFLNTPIDLNWTAPLAVIIIILFFFSTLAFPGKLDRLSVFMLLFIIFSSAIMLGVERANVDLIFFSSMTLAVVLNERSRLGSFSLLMLSVVFKIYPILGIGYFLGFEKKRALKYVFSAIALTILYFAITYQDMLHVFSATPKGDDMSYGWAVVPLFLKNQLSIDHVAIRLIFFGLMLVVLFRAVALAICQRSSVVIISNDQRNLGAFWLGAGIYTGTFLLGNNWDYRLMFLLFTIPQLVEWAQQNNRNLRRAARISLIMLTVSCWYFVIWKILSVFTIYGHSLAYLIDEYANWTLFSSLAFLIIYSLPDWFFKDFVGQIVKLGFKKDFQ